MLLLFVALTAPGCQAMIDGIGDKVDYEARVDDYRDHGMSRRDAERNAYEDQIWDKMDQ